MYSLSAAITSQQGAKKCPAAQATLSWSLKIDNNVFDSLPMLNKHALQALVMSTIDVSNRWSAVIAMAAHEV